MIENYLVAKRDEALSEMEKCEPNTRAINF